MYYITCTVLSSFLRFKKRTHANFRLRYDLSLEIKSNHSEETYRFLTDTQAKETDNVDDPPEYDSSVVPAAPPTTTTTTTTSVTSVSVPTTSSTISSSSSSSSTTRELVLFSKLLIVFNSVVTHSTRCTIQTYLHCTPTWCTTSESDSSMRWAGYCSDERYTMQCVSNLTVKAYMYTTIIKSAQHGVFYVHATMKHRSKLIQKQVLYSGSYVYMQPFIKQTILWK